MPPLAFHLVFRAIDDRVLAPNTAAQRTLAGIVHRLGEERGLLAFRASGDHLHVEAACAREEAGTLARTVAGSLTRRLGLPGFAPVRFTPCEDQRHLERAFLYILRNAEKHGTTGDPTHEASSVGALLGMRLAPHGFLTRVRRTFPRLDRADLLAVLGVKSLEPSFQLDHLADAAAGAVGLPALDGSLVAARARRAAARVAADEAPAHVVAATLDTSPRMLRRHRAGPADEPLEAAIGLRMGLLAALGDRARLDVPIPAHGPARPARALPLHDPIPLV